MNTATIRGRPVKYATIEERDAAAARSRAKSQAKMTSVTLPSDIHEEIKALSDRLEPTMGFKPTFSQTLRWMLKNAIKE